MARMVSMVQKAERAATGHGADVLPSPRQKTKKLTDPYVTAGDRAYVVGCQNGTFPDRGWHVEGEMGGVWSPPLKLLDGFWLEVNGSWMLDADRFLTGPFWTAQEYGRREGVEVTRCQFVPDARPVVVIRYGLRSAVNLSLKVRLLARSNLQMVWSRQTPEVRTPDTAHFLTDLGAWMCTGTSGACVVGAPFVAPCAWNAGSDLWGPERTSGNGTSVLLEYDLELQAGVSAHLHFLICGSPAGEAEARAAFEEVRENPAALWEEKASRYRKLLERSALDIPEPSITSAWDWIKCNYDWLLSDVPGVGRGLTAGAEEYMWWFGCDSSYAVLGCLALGQHETAIQTLDLVRTLSIRAHGESGRVIHECTTACEIVHPGCTQETPHHLLAVWNSFLWTGDVGFLRRSYDFCKRGLLDWTLQSQCPDGDLLPHGYGITETEGLDLQCIDTASHSAAALSALGDMAEVLGDQDTASQCRHLATLVRERLEAAFWMEDEGLYGDMVATSDEMIPRVQEWIRQAESGMLVEENRSRVLSQLHLLLQRAQSDADPGVKRPWLLGNWVTVSPLEDGLVDLTRAERVLHRLRGSEYSAAHGMYLNRLDHTHAMSINTGALAGIELRYGAVEEGLSRIRALTDTLDLHMPGAVSEMLPDYGCFVQAWSGYAVAWPIVTYLFGVQPNAHARTLELAPRFPIHWSHARLSNLRIGTATFDLFWNGETLIVTCDEAWTVTCSTLPMHLTSGSGPRAVR